MSTHLGIVQRGTDKDGKLVLSVGSKVKTFAITSSPHASAELAAKLSDLEDRNLGPLLHDLNLCSELLYLAYVGVQGTDLAGRVAQRQAELAHLCQECLSLMKSLQDGSRDSLNQLVTRAYQVLLRGDDAQALGIIGKTSKYANMMATYCHEIAGRFEKLTRSTQNDVVEIQKALYSNLGNRDDTKPGLANFAVKEASLVLEKMSSSAVGVRMDKGGVVKAAASALDDVSSRMESFWKCIAASCEMLAEHELHREISDVMEYEPQPLKRVIYYTGADGEDSFRKCAADHDMRWVAFSAVCTAYVNASASGGTRLARILIALDEAFGAGNRALLEHIKPDVLYLATESQRMLMHYKEASQSTYEVLQQVVHTVAAFSQQKQDLNEQLASTESEMAKVLNQIESFKQELQETKVAATAAEGTENGAARPREGLRNLQLSAEEATIKHRQLERKKRSLVAEWIKSEESRCRVVNACNDLERCNKLLVRRVQVTEKLFIDFYNKLGGALDSGLGALRLLYDRLYEPMTVSNGQTTNRLFKDALRQLANECDKSEEMIHDD